MYFILAKNNIFIIIKSWKLIFFIQIGDHSSDIKRGICARDPTNGTIHRNTAIMSVRRQHELMITRVVDLVVAHGNAIPPFMNPLISKIFNPSE